MFGVLNLLRDAILNKQVVVATYKGHVRQMCPHALGIKKGREQALFYQFAGSSRSGLEPGGAPNNWRCIPIDELQELSIVEGEWHTAPNYSAVKQTCIDEVQVEVSFS